MALPWRDPQFWLVSGAAVVALLFVVRKRFRFRRRGEVELPCDHCPSAARHGAKRTVTPPRHP